MERLLDEIRKQAWKGSPAVASSLAVALVRAAEDEGFATPDVFGSDELDFDAVPDWVYAGIAAGLPFLKELEDDGPDMYRFLGKLRGWFGSISTGDDEADEPGEELYVQRTVIGRVRASVRFANSFESEWRPGLAEGGLLTSMSPEDFATEWVVFSCAVAVHWDRPYRSEAALSLAEPTLLEGKIAALPHHLYGLDVPGSDEVTKDMYYNHDTDDGLFLALVNFRSFVRLAEGLLVKGRLSADFVAAFRGLGPSGPEEPGG